MESRQTDFSQSDGTVLITSTAPVSDKEAHSTATGSSSYHQVPVTAVEELGTSGSHLQHISNSDLQEYGQNDEFLTALDIDAAAQHEAAVVETSNHTAGVYQDAAGTSELQLQHMSTSELQELCQNPDFLTALDVDAAAHHIAGAFGTSNHSVEHAFDGAEKAMHSIANHGSTSDIRIPHGTAAFGSIASNTSVQSDSAAPMDISLDSREQEASL
ncbi:hypothetical protein ABBQ32_005183 [Trebouxia sp. C0010 RCD-2024]